MDIIKKLDITSIDEQVAVYRKAFMPFESEKKTKEKWYCKHYLNPLHESYIFGLYDGPILASINAYMPMKYNLNGIIVNVIQSCESATLPEYQGKGFWSKLVKYAVAYFKSKSDYDFIIGFPNIRNSFFGFIKMKWNTDLFIENYIFIVNGKYFFKLYNFNFLILNLLIEIQRIFLQDPGKQNLYKGSYKEISSTKSGFSLISDKEYMCWKTKYKNIMSFTLYNHHGAACVSCMYYYDYYKGQKIVIILSIQHNQSLTYNTALKYCTYSIIRDAPDVAFIRMWGLEDSDISTNIKKAGYIKTNHRNPFVSLLLKETKVSLSELNEKANWKNLSFYDLD